MRNLEVRSLTSGGGDKTVRVKQDGENHGVVYTGWCVRVMLKRDYSSYKRLSIFFSKQQYCFSHESAFWSGSSVASIPLLLLVSGRFEAWMLNYWLSRSHMPSGWCWLFTGHVGFSP